MMFRELPRPDGEPSQLITYNLPKIENAGAIYPFAVKLLENDATRWPFYHALRLEKTQLRSSLRFLIVEVVL